MITAHFYLSNQACWLKVEDKIGDIVAQEPIKQLNNFQGQHSNFCCDHFWGFAFFRERVYKKPFLEQ